MVIYSGGGVALALGALLAVSAAPTVAWAETVGAFEVTGGTQGTDYTYTAPSELEPKGGDTLTIKSGTPLTISTNSESGETDGCRIVIENKVTANITLAGVNITPTAESTNNGYSGIDLSSGATLNITLQSGSSNVIHGGKSETSMPGPGIHVPEGSTLTIDGEGSLEVQGASREGSGAVGIGGMGSASEAGEACGNVIILGGTITVQSGTPIHAVENSAVDIGGGASESGNGGNCSTVIILTSVNSSGSLEVGGGAGAGVGGHKGSDGSGIKPAGDGTYTVYGDLELPCDITIPQGATVTIPEGASLTVPQGTTLTNNGTILVQGGTFTNNGTVTGNQPTYPSTVTVSFSQNGREVTSVPYGSTVTITATMEKAATAANALCADTGKVDFYLGDANYTGLMMDTGTVEFVDGAYTASVDVTIGQDKGFNGPGTFKFSADFGGYVSVDGTGVSLAPNTGSAQLTVVKASQPFPADGVGYSVDYVDEAVIAEHGYELAASAGATEGSDTLTAVPGERFYVRVEGSETHEPSVWTPVDVAARPAAPEVDEAFAVAGPDVTGGEGVIAPIDGAQLEYRIGSEGAWADLPAEGIACTAGERVELRFKASASTFASEIASVTVPDHAHVGAGAWKGDADGHWRICGSVACGERVDRAPHAFGAWNETVAASCTEAGEEERVCTVCGYAETRSAPALGHLWGDWVTEKEPTYDAEGEEVRTCSLCGETESRVLERLTDGAEGDGPSRPAHEAEGDRGDAAGPATGVIPSTGDMGTGAVVLAASAALGTLALGIVCRRRS